jgi:hypothetical protein
MPAAEREVVDPEHRERVDLLVEQVAEQAQCCRVVCAPDHAHLTMRT